MTVRPAADLFLVRHGRTAWHSPNRYTGSSDIGIDEIGVAQADALAHWARDARLSALYSSPMARTMATAEPVSHETGLSIRAREPLREIDFGVAEGRTIDDMAATDPDAVTAFLADPVTGHWPGGDDPAERAESAAGDLATIAADHPGERVMVIAHSTLLRLVLCRLLGVPLRRYREAIGRPEPAAVSTVRWDGTKPATLLAFNVPTAGVGPPAPRSDTVI